MASHDRRPDEETPLLQAKSKTPLPWGQMSLAFLALTAEPISFLYIFAFINQVSQQSFLLTDTHVTVTISSSASSVSREETTARLVIMQVSS